MSFTYDDLNDVKGFKRGIEEHLSLLWEVANRLGVEELNELGYADRMCCREAIICEKWGLE